MNNLNTDKEKIDYNSIPVLYCKNCLSLKIRNVSSIEDSDYCDECGSLNIEKTTIDEWEKLYINRYGHKYIEQYSNRKKYLYQY